MNLSEHFTFAELTRTDTGLPNNPSPRERANLIKTAAYMELVRAALGSTPIHINSAYRSPLVNSQVKGSATSAHVWGYAVDFVAPQFGTPESIVNELRVAGIHFDQLIYEHPANSHPWVHISFDPRMRGQILECARLGHYTSF
jgi:hypothetical protein